MRELALFAGAGGGILGGTLLGWRTVCAVEFNSFCCRRLMQRQNEGHLPPFPIWDDVRTFDGRPWRGVVDVISGGFPCQDISAAGKGAGIDGERSGLWREFARIIGEVRPRFAFVENSPNLTSRGLGRVLGDLAEMGFDAEWCMLGACDVGAPHERQRIWIVANSAVSGREALSSDKVGTEQGCKWWSGSSAYSTWGENRSSIARVDDGVADRVDRLKAIGNGQVPAVAALAWKVLTERMMQRC